MERALTIAIKKKKMKFSTFLHFVAWKWKQSCGSSSNINILDFPLLFAQHFTFLDGIQSSAMNLNLGCILHKAETTHSHAHKFAYYDNEKWI